MSVGPVLDIAAQMLVLLVELSIRDDIRLRLFEYACLELLILILEPDMLISRQFKLALCLLQVVVLPLDCVKKLEHLFQLVIVLISFGSAAAELYLEALNLCFATAWPSLATCHKAIERGILALELSNTLEQPSALRCISHYWVLGSFGNAVDETRVCMQHCSSSSLG